MKATKRATISDLISKMETTIQSNQCQQNLYEARGTNTFVLSFVPPLKWTKGNPV